MSENIRWGHAGAWVLAALLAGCGGGGGGGGGGDAPSPGSGSGFSGRVIYDAPIAQAQVSIRDAEGRTWQTTTDSTGRYHIDLEAGATATPPFIVRAQGVGQRWEIGSGATASTSEPSRSGSLTPALVPGAVDRSKAIAMPFSLYATSNEVGNVPVSPSTTLVVAQLTGNRAEAAFLNLGSPGTTIAAAFERSLVQAAQTKVKQVLALLGLPASLVDDPADEALVSVDLTSTYEKLVSGDVFSAAVTFMGALADNQIKYGCSGEAWGTMADDGQRRPSCLPGANASVSHLVSNFKGVDTPRSTDVETRAAELAGTHGPGGGWKFQSERIERAQRIADLQLKVAAAFKYYDAHGNLSGTPSAALAWLATWDENAWSNLNRKLCESVTTKELSDLTHSYLELKRNMRHSAPAPKEDAAEGLDPSKPFMTGTRAVNRIVPLFFNDGVREDVCPILNKHKTAVRTLVGDAPVLGGVASGPARPPLAGLLNDLYATLDAWEAAALRGAPRSEFDAAMAKFIEASVNVNVSYPTVVDPGLGLNEKIFMKISRCYLFGAAADYCTENTYTSAQYKADTNALAAQVPASEAAGAGAGAGATTIGNFGASIAQFLIDEYEQRFDDYFESAEIYYAVEVQGYVVDHGLVANERDASIVVPDVSGVGYKVNGGSLELTGQFAMRSVDARIGAVDANVTPALRRLTGKVLIHPGIVPAVASCVSADQACMGRLRRTRAFTPLAAIPLSGSVTLEFAVSSTWQSAIGAAARDHAEALPYRWPLAIEELFTLIEP